MEFTVSFGNNIMQPDDIMPYRSLKEILEFQSYSEKLQWQIEDIRNAETKEERKELKKNLPYIVGSIFEPSVRHAKNLLKTNLMIFDIDGIENVEEVFETLKNDRSALFIFRSPSGNGLKFGVGLKENVTDPQLFSDVYKYASQVFSEFYKINLDNTSDCSRACFLSFDEKYYWNDNPVLFPVRVKKEEPIVYEEQNFTTELESIDQEEEFQLIANICRTITITDYQDWIRAGMALKTIFQGEELFVMLSVNKGYKDDVTSIRYKFRTFTKDGAVTIKSFFHLAKQYGYDVSGAYREIYKKRLDKKQETGIMQEVQ